MIIDKIMHTKRLIVALALTLVGGAAYADDYKTALDFIVSRNPTVASTHSAAEATKKENQTGLTLANPEGKIGYQLGTPAGVPPRTQVELGQSFDFATLSGAKRKVAQAKNRQTESSVNVTLRDITSQVDEKMTESVYRYQLAQFYGESLRMMTMIYDAAERSFKAGQISAVDLNSIRMELNNLKTEARNNDIELNGTRSLLLSYAGGQEFSWAGDQYMDYQLPADFVSWSNANAIAASPQVTAAKSNIDVANSEIVLREKEGLPSFSIGYIGEFVKDANYNGLSVGFDIPLWANRGRVNAAKAAKASAEMQLASAETELNLRRQTEFAKAQSLAQAAIETRRLSSECDNREGVRKLYEHGEISTHEYLMQLMSILNLQKQVIDNDYAYQSSLVALRSLQ